MQSQILHKRIILGLSFQFIFYIASSQVFLSWDLKATHLPFNKIGGIHFSNDFEFASKRNSFHISGHLSYATGNGGFAYNKDNEYTLVDGENRELYPLQGIIPGLPEDAYITVLALNTAKTIENGFSISYSRLFINKNNLDVKVRIGLNFSWIEESSIAYAFKGDFTNVFGTARDINLVIPFTQKYFDLGPQLSINSYFIGKDNLILGISGDLVWLTKTGFMYSLGPTFRFNL